MVKECLNCFSCFGVVGSVLTLHAGASHLISGFLTKGTVLSIVIRLVCPWGGKFRTFFHSLYYVYYVYFKYPGRA